MLFNEQALPELTEKKDMPKNGVNNAERPAEKAAKRAQRENTNSSQHLPSIVII